MTVPDELIPKIDQAGQLYHQLVLVVGPSGSGKTQVLKELARAQGWALLNLNLELTRRLLELTERQRQQRASRMVAEIVESTATSPVLLDNTELLFEPSLQLEPLRLLQGVARDRTVVASWHGQVDSGQLTHAVPGHPEFKRYATQELLLVELTRDPRSQPQGGMA